MRVLITGASGFIGGHLFYRAPSDWEVWGTYLNSAIQGDTSRLLRLDLHDQMALQAVLDGIKPDIVIHCAAYSRVRFCESTPTASWEMNSQVTAQLASLTAERRTRLIFLSSDMVFDGTKGHYAEGDDPRPINFYGWSKLAAERRIARLNHKSVILRVNLTYGRPKLGGTSFSEEVIQTVRAGKPYHLFADQFRSFISVQNLARCIREIAAGDFVGTLHLGGGEAADRVTFARKLAKRVGLNPSLLIPSTSDAVLPEIAYPRNNTFDLTLATRLLKTPLLDLDAGLETEYSA